MKKSIIFVALIVLSMISTKANYVSLYEFDLALLGRETVVSGFDIHFDGLSLPITKIKIVSSDKYNGVSKYFSDGIDVTDVINDAANTLRNKITKKSQSVQDLRNEQIKTAISFSEGTQTMAWFDLNFEGTSLTIMKITFPSEVSKYLGIKNTRYYSFGVDITDEINALISQLKVRLGIPSLADLINAYLDCRMNIHDNQCKKEKPEWDDNIYHLPL